ncbi:putative magnesium transporter NIPA5 [Hibiscus syriacus]|uniref:Probable magnesium transporter n=1 Tax=Hibiscus syriacus TaxID=106335 RepID=A0A6A3BD56_HIBSY|nr:putative magnesium transporter NIPA5 [Hibiscus syriacus]
MIKGMSPDNVRGLVLAVSSSIFIGSSFIIKKQGLKKAGASGPRAGQGGHSYLYEPLWWAGMITISQFREGHFSILVFESGSSMSVGYLKKNKNLSNIVVFGEIANFAAYAYAPAILVTPLGALSIIFSAVLAHFILKERLHIFGMLGCALCVVGSTTIVLHAPKERNIESVKQVWQLATEPAVIIFRYVPRYGQTHLIVYIGICSLMGSLTVMGVKAVGIALKLSFGGMNQFKYYETWIFTAIVIFCCLLQVNYLNKALDTFNTAVVCPVYYVMFTTLTIFASMIMFKGCPPDAVTYLAPLCACNHAGPVDHGMKPNVKHYGTG